MSTDPGFQDSIRAKVGADDGYLFRWRAPSFDPRDAAKKFEIYSGYEDQQRWVFDILKAESIEEMLQQISGFDWKGTAIAIDTGDG